MRYTRRLLELRLTGALAVILAAGLCGVTASCSSEDDPVAPPATGDAADAASDAVGVDAGRHDVGDAAPIDASPLPVDCNGPSCGVSIGAGPGESFCALLQDGSVVCWGQNDTGQLGRGPDASSYGSETPARIVDLPKIVHLGRSCAIDDTGGTWCWGTGPYLRDETNGTTKETTPVKLPIASAASAGVRSLYDFAVACAASEGSVLCWGSNTNGQVAMPAAGADPFMGWAPQDVGVPPGAPIRELIVADATFALRADGSLSSWGANPPLGRLSSLFPDPHPKPIALPNVTSVDAMFDEVCAVSNGAVYCWGGRHDFAATSPLVRALPELVLTPEPVSQVATATTAFRDDHRRGCAVGLSGSVYCWWNNDRGQAGDGTKDFAIAPVKVKGLPAPAAEVRTTAKATCALLTSGTIYCWGDDYFGQLGTGVMRSPDFAPQEVVLP